MSSMRSIGFSRWVAAAATIVAFAAAGIAAEQAAAASATITASPDAITYGQGTVEIRGFLTADPGISPAGRTLKLYERPYPYKSSQQIATTVTDANGHYVFEDVAPDLNSTYKVAINDPDLAARSKSQMVVVFARGTLSVRATPDRHVASRFRLVFSPDLPTDLADRQVFWYFNEIGKPRYVIKDKTLTEEPHPGLLVGRSRFTPPPGQYKFRVTYCIDVPNQEDIGVGPPGAPRTCPRSFPAETARVLRSAGSAAGRI